MCHFILKQNGALGIESRRWLLVRRSAQPSASLMLIRVLYVEARKYVCKHRRNWQKVYINTYQSMGMEDTWDPEMNAPRFTTTLQNGIVADRDEDLSDIKLRRSLILMNSKT